MAARRAVAGGIGGLALAAVLAACGGSSGSVGPAAGAPSGFGGLRCWPVPILVSGDETDDLDASRDGRWWLVSSYPQEIDYRIDTVTGVVRQRADHDYDHRPDRIDGTGAVSRAAEGGPGDVLLDRTRGRELRQRHGVIVLRGPGSAAYRRVGTGYPVAAPETGYPSSRGSVSSDGRWVTVPTRTPYAPGDTGHGVDVYQLDTRGGGWSRITVAGDSAVGTGVAASATGRYVAFVARPPGHGSGPVQALRWDRTTGRTVLVSRTPGGAPGDGDATGDLSVSATGVVSFVTYATDLVPGPHQRDEPAHLCTAGRHHRAGMRPTGSELQRG